MQLRGLATLVHSAMHAYSHVAIDVETCPRCTGPMKILAFVTEPRSLARLLTHAGLPSDIPSIASAPAPPQSA